MIDNPWLPIDTMPLSTVGTSADVQDKQRLYSGITVSGIRYERDVLIEKEWGGEERTYMGDIADFTITHTAGSIHLTPAAEWRPHA